MPVEGFEPSTATPPPRLALPPASRHVLAILPVRASFELCLRLPETVPPERFRGERGKRDAAPSFVRLWLRLLVSPARQLARDPRENTAYLQRPLLQVEILPLEREQPPSPHAGRQGGDEQR